MIKITIITVCFNSEKYIEDCITSIVSQTYSNIEYIIVDGGSTDGTVDLIKKYEYGITKWISEKDKGIADAMNKGIRFATGDYILFIHSDDYLLNQTSISDAVKIMYFNADFNAFAILSGNRFKNIEKTSEKFSFNFYLKTKIMHQGCFCSRSVFDMLGLFDVHFKIAMDYDFFFRAYRHGCSIRCFNFPISFMRDTGISSRKDWASLKLRFMEEQKVHYKNCKKNLIYRLYWFLYPKYRYLRCALRI